MARRRFCEFAHGSKKRPVEFVKFVEKLDPTCGEPEERQIVMTSIFRTKGLDYDYVLSPQCEEGYMPCLVGNDNPIYDKAGIVVEPESSEVVENERRLFYVAVTRAKKGVFIGTAEPPKKGSQQNSFPARMSRFIWELRAEATTELMNAFQRLASGFQEAKKQLQWGIQRYGGSKSVVRRLLSLYLRAIGEKTFAGELEIAASRVPENSEIYPPGFSLKKTAEVLKSSENRPWWEQDQSADVFLGADAERHDVAKRRIVRESPSSPIDLPQARSAPDTDVEIAAHSFGIGDRVRHPKYGVGTIDRVVGSGDDQLVTIKFNALETKTTHLKYAKLELIDSP